MVYSSDQGNAGGTDFSNPERVLQSLLPRQVGHQSYSFLSSSGLARVINFLSSPQSWNYDDAVEDVEDAPVPAHVILYVADFISSAFAELSDSAIAQNGSQRSRIQSTHQTATARAMAIHRACMDGAAAILLLAVSITQTGDTTVSLSDLAAVVAHPPPTPRGHTHGTSSAGSVHSSRPNTSNTGVQNVLSRPISPQHVTSSSSLHVPRGGSRTSPTPDTQEWFGIPNRGTAALYLAAYLSAEAIIESLPFLFTAPPSIIHALVAAAVAPAARRAERASYSTSAAHAGPTSASVTAIPTPLPSLRGVSPRVTPAASPGRSAAYDGLGPQGVGWAGWSNDEAAAQFGAVMGDGDDMHRLDATAIAAVAVLLSLSAQPDVHAQLIERGVEAVCFELAVDLSAKAPYIRLAGQGGAVQTSTTSRKLASAVAPSRLPTHAPWRTAVAAQRHALPETLEDLTQPTNVTVNGIFYPDAAAVLGVAIASALVAVILCDAPRPLACCEILRSQCTDSALTSLRVALNIETVTGIHALSVEGSMLADPAERRTLRGARQVSHHHERDHAVASAVLLTVFPVLRVLIDLIPPPVCVQMLHASPTASVSAVVGGIDAICVAVLAALPRCVPNTGMIAQPVGVMVAAVARRLAVASVRALSMRTRITAPSPRARRPSATVDASKLSSVPLMHSPIFGGGPPQRARSFSLICGDAVLGDSESYVGAAIAPRGDLRWSGRTPADAPHEGAFPAGLRSLPWNMLVRLIARLPPATGAVSSLRFCVLPLAMLHAAPYESDEIIKDTIASPLAPSHLVLTRLLPDASACMQSVHVPPLHRPTTPLARDGIIVAGHTRSPSPFDDAAHGLASQSGHAVAPRGMLFGGDHSFRTQSLIPQSLNVSVPAAHGHVSSRDRDLSGATESVPAALPFASKFLLMFTHCGSETARQAHVQPPVAPTSRRRTGTGSSSHALIPNASVSSPMRDADDHDEDSTPAVPDGALATLSGGTSVATVGFAKGLSLWSADFMTFGCEPVLRALLLAQQWRDAEQKAARDAAALLGRTQSVQTGPAAEYQRASVLRRQAHREALLQQHASEAATALRVHDEQRALLELDFSTRLSDFEEQLAAAKAVDGNPGGTSPDAPRSSFSFARARTSSRTRSGFKSGRRSVSSTPRSGTSNGPGGSLTVPPGGSPLVPIDDDGDEVAESVARGSADVLTESVENLDHTKIGAAMQDKTRIMSLMASIRDLNEEREHVLRAHRATQVDDMQRLEVVQQQQQAVASSGSDVEQDVCIAEATVLWMDVEHDIATARQMIFAAAAAAADAIACTSAQNIGDVYSNASEAWATAERGWTTLLRCVDAVHARRLEALGANRDAVNERAEASVDEMGEVVLRIEREAVGHMMAWATDAMLCETLDGNLAIDRLVEHVGAAVTVLGHVEESVRVGRSASHTYLSHQLHRVNLDTQPPAVRHELHRVNSSLTSHPSGRPLSPRSTTDDDASRPLLPRSRGGSFLPQRPSTSEPPHPVTICELLVQVDGTVRDGIVALEAAVRSAMYGHHVRFMSASVTRSGAHGAVIEAHARGSVLSQESAEWFTLVRRHLDAVRVLGGIYALPGAVVSMRQSIAFEEISAREACGRQVVADVEAIQRSWIVWGCMHRAHAERLPFVRPSTAGARPDVPQAVLLSMAFARPIARQRQQKALQEKPPVRLPSTADARKRSPFLAPLPLSAALLRQRWPLPPHQYEAAVRSYEKIAADNAESARLDMVGAAELNEITQDGLRKLKGALRGGHGARTLSAGAESNGTKTMTVSQRY